MLDVLSSDTGHTGQDDLKPCNAPFPLSQLELHKPDKLHNEILKLIWVGQEYAVYRSSEGVYVHFSDCPETEREQRKRFTEVCPELCELRYLTAQMSHSWWRTLALRAMPRLSFLQPREERGRALYEHNMAQALMLLMEGNTEGAKVISRNALSMAVRRVSNDNRIRYVRACLITGAIWVLIATALFNWPLFAFADSDIPRWNAYVIASMFGAAGSVFSIATRLQNFELKPCNDSRMNVWMSMVRVGMGIVAAIVLLLFAKMMLHDMVFPKAVGGRIPLEGAAILGFLGGFAERLVPNLLRQTASRLETSDGTPVQAARSQSATLTAGTK
jgi:hypothetical protein